MANFNEQVLRVWDEWEAHTGKDANDPTDFVSWAMAHKKLAPYPQDIVRLLRKQVTTALRQAMRTDQNGITYRAKQCYVTTDNGHQIPLWFDTDHGGTPQLRQKAMRQRRDRVADKVYRALCDADHMNFQFPKDPQLNFFTDFTEDCAERRAADLMDDDEDDVA